MNRYLAHFVWSCAALCIMSGARVRVAHAAQEIPGCGTLENGFGPYDYRAPGNRANLEIVERFHFTEQVESLSRGQSSSIIGDLDYALRAFPNHARALRSVTRYYLGGGRPDQAAVVPSLDCYFARAAAFAPNDIAVRVLYGSYLLRKKDMAGATEQYEQALKIAPESPEVQYNAGLFFLAIGDVQRASSLADAAYKAGYPLPGLRNKLQALKSKPD